MATGHTSSEGNHTRVRKRSGRSYIVRRAKDDHDGPDADRSVSIRTEKLWRLGTLEEGTIFHASHKHRKRKWVWGYATSGPGGTPHLSYAAHSRCGWVLRANLEPFRRGHEPPYKKPPISYKRWNDRVYRSIQFLWVNYGRFRPTEEQRREHKPGTRRKNSPVPTRRAADVITAYKNSGGRGESHPVLGPVGVRYLNTSGYYMAWARGVRWCFIKASDLHPPVLSEARAKRYTSAQARRRGG
ncbi:MAG TPA: hypothetical protein VGB85_08790 [Nannocystis sp.]|jgi:hypothetical protein